MYKLLKAKKNEYKQDKEIIKLLNDLELFYNYYDKFNFRLEEVFVNKALSCCSKMLYNFLVFKGGVYKYESKTELYNEIGMTHPLILKAIKELQEREFIKYSKKEKFLIIA